MPKKNLAKDTLGLLHSDKRVMEILNESNKYLEQHTEIKEKLEHYNWVLRSLSELAPQTPDNFWSGHIFPIAEAEYELETSIVLSKLGFYKHAIAALRNVLELGMLSVYWDIDDKSHIDIQNWLKSKEGTPFKKEVFKRLKQNQNIKELEERQNIFNKTAKIYERLSNFSHTKGFGYSSRGLNMHSSNVNSFNEASLNKWLNLVQEVVEIVTIFHVMKYPVGLQNTPMDEKFGLNGPAGGFLNPHQVERIKNIISSREVLKDMQKISDNDEGAKSMTEWVNSQPDITEADFELHIESQDQMSIKYEGFPHWFKNQKRLYKYFEKKNPEEYAKKIEYFKKMKQWAKDNGYLKKRSND